MKKLIKNYSEPWYDRWEDTMRDFPENGIEFLQDGYIIKANEVLLLDEEPLKALLEAVSYVRDNSFLSKLVWHFSHMIFDNPTEINPWDVPFPQLVNNDRNINDFLGLIILMSGFDKILKFHKSKNISAQVTIDTFKDIKLWLNDFYRKNGRWGIVENQWLTHHFTGKLFRLGRLQFAMDRFKGNVKVFKNKHDGSVIALSEEDIWYRRDGQVNGTNNIYETEGIWLSQFQEDEEYYRGNPISPHGRAINKAVELSKSDWQLMMVRDDRVLDMHIPADGRMDYDLCGQSMEAAEEFFPKYFPEWEYKGFTCTTWLFDPQFQKLLPASSNIVRFQQEFYLYPVKSDDSQTFERVFDKKPEDFNKAPRDTSLRRIIIDHYLQGEYLRSAGGFILKEDLNWGSQVYQKNQID